MAFQQQKQKLKSANKGKDLLKRKADALKVQFRRILKDLIDRKKDLGESYNKALIYLAKANFSAINDIGRTIDENVKNKSEIKLSLKTKNTAGVTTPQFELRNVEAEKYGGDQTILGITGGGQSLNVAKKHFLDYLRLIVDIATLQTSYKAIDESLKITNRRVNALEYIVIPRIQFVLKYIKEELDERSKEDLFRIRKVLQNKKKHLENELKQKGKYVEKEVAAVFDEEEEEGEDLLFK